MYLPYVYVKFVIFVSSKLCGYQMAQGIPHTGPAAKLNGGEWHMHKFMKGC